MSATIDKLNYYAFPRSEMLQFLPKEVKNVLDVGCGEGTFAAQLKAQKPHLWVEGLELFPEAAKQAAQRLDKVYVGKIEALMDQLPRNHYDVIYFNDVLEHTAEPEAILHAIKSHLSPQGCIIASIPNIRHIGTLFKLIVLKDWKYTDSGILDRTHLRFFTRKSMLRLFADTDYKVDVIQGIRPSQNPLVMLFNLVTLGFFADTRYFQFAIRAYPAQK